MEDLKSKIDTTKLPQHVAIIMDGNGRWAKSRGEERTYGHRSAIQAVRNAINACNEVHIPFLTLYTFSTENWNRPEDEVSTLMQLLSETLLNEADEIYTKGLRLKVVGDISEMPEMVREQLLHVMDLTKDNKGGTLVLALNYGAQAEIIRAVKSIAEDVKDGKVSPESIDNHLFENHLYTKDMPPVDLMIRTSGEIRISNFLLWQIAYAELQFLDIFWPDFTKDDFFNCILNYQDKERRYGKTSEQIGADKA
ncbi:UDP pyrophosphate synthase [Elizabethkingia meningoseptica]|uniref:isoprenyl transferase n=1 Tax=Elizabethkingia meningoseptica TaxID=238 RepID=UPI000332D173|nr:isoprenyl transferase [Elizabethkingia meningoseptica]AQX04160.1 di-trans,poly-cis-decaprenylcistransferase [Elizabethkingia meningoseptica]AQX46201.1 UDP pyrophosphate synthase [Elizabethkingia meningoseptica]EOR30715.1 UDP pyrophosphate synthetase [Elizabethkingia meningoseptica ATCC 13253 = NBRC 12535]KUY18717.1 UDP pyrophosphate synthase [Elizabethkingia meningoseptica]OPB73310.1 di-trans,poly-cis-decaprenylcistransferase [Elizabethkingia meningoseptica]